MTRRRKKPLSQVIPVREVEQNPHGPNTEPITAEPTSGVGFRKVELDLFLVDKNGTQMRRPFLEQYKDEFSRGVVGWNFLNGPGSRIRPPLPKKHNMNLPPVQAEITRGATNMTDQGLMGRDRQTCGCPNAEPYFQGRLTKAILMSLPAGVILQSNVGPEPFAPDYEAVLGLIEQREEVWAKLRKLRLPGIMFRAFATRESFDNHIRERLKAISPGLYPAN